MTAIRPLPARPNLEFEHKQAKSRLRELRATQPDAKLADVQLAIAREYGFASWPKLVRYFEDVERQTYDDGRLPNEQQHLEHVARSFAPQLKRHIRQIATAFAAYVPRFYGLQLEDIFGAEVTEDETRLVVARMNGYPSWEALLERLALFKRQRAERRPPDRLSGMHVVFADDAGSLDTLLAKYPAQLNEFLCGGMKMKPHVVRRLLEKGADPNHVMPNGIPVLEYALLRYWNGEAVDVLAVRATPRKALWIAAGLGDLAGVRASLDRHGKPTKEARQLRPDNVAAGFPGAAHPEAGDEEILTEAFYVATLNGRTKVMEYLASRGYDVNARVWDSPILNWVVQNGWDERVECLLRCGADPDIKGYHPNASAREISREMYAEMTDFPDRRRRIVELLGMDPAAIMAERNATPPPEPIAAPGLLEDLKLAADDAARQGVDQVGVENLLWGMLRQTDGMGGLFTQVSRMQDGRFRSDHASRLLDPGNRLQRAAMTMNAEAQAVMRAAIALAKVRRRENLTSAHLLYALLNDGGGSALTLLTQYGGNSAALANALETSL